MSFIKIVKKAFVYFVVLLALSMMVFTISSVTSVNKDKKGLFGYKAFIVLSDSMKATDFASGDLVLVKEVDPSSLEVGDIIAYSSQATENFGETVTHKIREKTVNDKGEVGFITYGTSTNTDDPIVVTYPYILGKYVRNLPKVGSFFMFLKTTPGYIICIFIPFVILILLEGVRSIKLFKKYKMQQEQELRKEKEEIEKQRQEAARLLEEIQQIKQELQQRKN